MTTLRRVSLFAFLMALLAVGSPLAQGLDAQEPRDTTPPEILQLVVSTTSGTGPFTVSFVGRDALTPLSSAVGRFDSVPSTDFSLVPDDGVLDELEETFTNVPLDTSGLSPGLHRLDVTLTDEVGNIGTAFVDFTITEPEPPTDPVIQIRSLQDSIDEAFRTGLITNESTRQRLNKKLDDAVNGLARENTKNAINQLNAFVNQVKAQSGKAINTVFASELVTLVQQQLLPLFQREPCHRGGTTPNRRIIDCTLEGNQFDGDQFKRSELRNFADEFTFGGPGQPRGTCVLEDTDSSLSLQARAANDNASFDTGIQRASARHEFSLPRPALENCCHSFKTEGDTLVLVFAKVGVEEDGKLARLTIASQSQYTIRNDQGCNGPILTNIFVLAVNLEVECQQDDAAGINRCFSTGAFEGRNTTIFPDGTVVERPGTSIPLSRRQEPRRLPPFFLKKQTRLAPKTSGFFEETVVYISENRGSLEVEISGDGGGESICQGLSSMQVFKFKAKDTSENITLDRPK